MNIRIVALIALCMAPVVLAKNPDDRPPRQNRINTLVTVHGNEDPVRRRRAQRRLVRIARALARRVAQIEESGRRAAGLRLQNNPNETGLERMARRAGFTLATGTGNINNRRQPGTSVTIRSGQPVGQDGRPVLSRQGVFYLTERQNNNNSNNNNNN